MIFTLQRCLVGLGTGSVAFVALAACGSSGGTSADAGPDTAVTIGDAGGGSETTTTTNDTGAAPESSTADAEGGSAEGGTLGFGAANVPAGTALAAPGDWVISSQSCGGKMSVKIDTSMGTSDCDGPPKAYSYSMITQPDTSLGSLQAGLFVTNKFTIETGMTVTVVGNLPLVLVALSDVNISGHLNATIDSVRADKAYAGGASGPAASTSGTGPGGGATTSGMSGAGGGGFCGNGGDGAAPADAGVAGGKAYGNATNVPLLGGSSGGSGTGVGGGGGGAIQIDSATSIQVTAVGTINAGGGGGGATRSGGGSGGAILLEAPSVSVAGTLAANGGGGAESGGQHSGQNAQTSVSPAAGGAAEFSTTNAQITNAGGAGAAGTTLDGSASALLVSNSNAGGGGGGAGRIRIDTTSGSATIAQTAVLSPALTTMCATQGTLGH
jgi:hypothetical protein